MLTRSIFESARGPDKLHRDLKMATCPLAQRNRPSVSQSIESMHPFFETAMEFIALVATCAAILLAALVLRNPKSPKIVKSEGVAVAAGIVLVAALMVAVGYAFERFQAAGLNYYGAALAVVLIMLASVITIWKVFRLSDRLDRANAGLSPFHRLTNRI